MPFFGRRGAGSRRPAAALDLHQAQPAGAERLQLSVAQKRGILVPRCIAAAMTEVPAGTLTFLAVDGEVTVLFRLPRIGVP
jgi:hypothetical protein